jgi:hypothetical protein
VTSFETDDSDETFEVSPDPGTVVMSPEFEGANVCRVAALSTRFGDDRQTVADLADEFGAFGFSAQVVSTDRSWSEVGPLELFTGLTDRADSLDDTRRRAWDRLNDSGGPGDAVGFLVAILGSELERESAAAAAVLWRILDGLPDRIVPPDPRIWYLWERSYFDISPDGLPFGRDLWSGLQPWPAVGVAELPGEEVPGVPWDPTLWRTLFDSVTRFITGGYEDLWLVTLFVRRRLAQALRSPDQVTRSLALAAFSPAGRGFASPAGPPPSPVAAPSQPLVSTMIHGTWGWKSDWWRPGTTFHDFVLNNHRANLYARGAKFSWSGAYSDRQRAQAAVDFKDWAGEIAKGGLETVFGHSYGGEVAARAATATSVQQLVLLSSPATNWVDTAAKLTALKVVDVRLRFDPVLGIARTPQRLTVKAPNVTEVLLKRRRLSHGATHEEPVWRKEKIAQRGGI